MITRTELQVRRKEHFPMNKTLLTTAVLAAANKYRQAEVDMIRKLAPEKQTAP